MKYIQIMIVAVLASMLCIKASAQESLIDDVNYVQLEEYIALAKENNPRNKIVSLNEKRTKTAVHMQTVNLLDIISASYYYRPESKTAINPENPYVFNGFQFGLNLSLGSLVEKPFLMKQAKIDYQIAQMESLDYEKVLILEVKNRYYVYLLQLKELKLRTQTAQDAQAITNNISLQFERGEVEIGDYNNAKSNSNAAILSKIQTEMSFLFAKDQLEELIGRKLTEGNK